MFFAVLLSDTFVFFFVARYLCILLASLRHELREVLLFGLGDRFGLKFDLESKQIRKWRANCTFIFTMSEPP